MVYICFLILIQFNKIQNISQDINNFNLSNSNLFLSTFPIYFPTIRSNKNPTTGTIVEPANITNKITNTKPKRSKDKNFSRARGDKKAANTLEPSSGGIGTKLNTANIKLI